MPMVSINFEATDSSKKQNGCLLYHGDMLIPHDPLTDFSTKLSFKRFSQAFSLEEIQESGCGILYGYLPK